MTVYALIYSLLALFCCSCWFQAGVMIPLSVKIVIVPDHGIIVKILQWQTVIQSHVWDEIVNGLVTWFRIRTSCGRRAEKQMMAEET